MIYQHTQPGWVIRIILAITIVLMVVIWYQVGLHMIFVGVVAVLLLMLALFHALTVEVTVENLSFWFGPGMFRKSHRVDGIESVAIVRNHWFYGWGIHLTPRGWSYNVSGFDAVEVTMTSGKRFRVGTDEPEALVEAIREAAGATS